MPKRAFLSSLAATIAGLSLAALLLRRHVPFGSSVARRRFRRRNSPFLRKLPRLRQLIRLGIDRDLSAGPAADRVIHLLARRAADDFEEILLLASNGFGFGSLSLVRGMYERIVTAFHLHFNPDDTDAFTDYHCVQRRKLANAIGSSIEAPLTPELLKQLDDAFQAVKAKYEVVLCKECGAKGTNFRWHKLDLVAMAKKTGVDSIRDLLVRAYYIPLEHAHSTAGSLLYQLTEANGQPAFKSQQDPIYADQAVAVAHLLVILAVAAIRMQLKVAALQPLIDECARDHDAAWS